MSGTDPTVAPMADAHTDGAGPGPNDFVPVLVDALDRAGVPISPTTKDQYLELVSAAASVRRAGEEILDDSVRAARTGGASWAAIGDRLGMSRQAAQQRFGGAPVPADSELTRILGPVTAFDELRELNLAGEQGWHSIGFGLLHHVVQRSDTQWEHQRASWLPGVVKRHQDQGWELIGTSFPWVYFKRDLGKPALPAPADREPSAKAQ